MFDRNYYRQSQPYFLVNLSTLYFNSRFCHASICMYIFPVILNWLYWGSHEGPGGHFPTSDVNCDTCQMLTDYLMALNDR